MLMLVAPPLAGATGILDGGIQSWGMASVLKDIETINGMNQQVRVDTVNRFKIPLWESKSKHSTL